jgi:hypothetical protein
LTVVGVVVVVHGGVKVYRGNAAAARTYLEADHARVDDYYLAEGTGLAERLVATPDGGVERVGVLDSDDYEAWVAGLDPVTGQPRGRLRTDPNAVRFVEVVVNGPKTWSLAAALHPEIADAYDAAQDRAATQIVGWLAGHATTRVGPRGRQVQVPVERIEAVTVRHYTSRAGDPHRHLHLQVNARVWAEQKWRGLHTVGVRDMIDALNGIGHAAVACDPEFRRALAGHGFTLDPATSEVEELTRFVGPFSARARQIGKNLDRYEAEWRLANPGVEPGPALLRAWDRRAWSEARPDKVVPMDGGELTDRWVTELRRLGYRHREPRPLHQPVVKTGQVEREAAVEVVLSRLGARRSGWNAADVRGEVEQLLARGSSSPRTSPREPWRRAYRCWPSLGRPNTFGRSPRLRCWRSRSTSPLGSRPVPPRQDSLSGCGAGTSTTPNGALSVRWVATTGWSWSKAPPVPGRPRP